MAGTEEQENKTQPQETAQRHSRPTQAEVLDLKNKYRTDCKVIQNVGEFAFVVRIQIPGKDLAIKFQIEETYPETTPNLVIQSGQMDAKDKEALHQYLAAETSKLHNTPMLDTTVNLTLAWVADRDLDLTIKAPRNGDRKNKNGRRQRKGTTTAASKKSDDDEDGGDAKKPPMKTSEDVISRIMWDDSLPSDCFFVGYMDRFLGIVEEAFTALSWENIASADYNTLVIPKHRIVYFKYKDMKVWDKKKRLDNVFGSTGSGVTIHDAIAQWEAEHAAAVPVQQPKYDTDDDDDDEDDIVIHTGCGDDDNATNDDADDDHLQYKRDAYWGAKIRPTHFLALRITEPSIVAAVKEAHTICTDMEPTYEECIIPTERLHITLACLGLDNEESIGKATEILQELKSELASNNPLDIVVELEKVDHFFHTTLHVKVKENKKFCDFVEHLRMCLTEAGVELRDLFEFEPHMTLLKLSGQFKRDTRNPYLDTRLYTMLEGTTFGSQVVDNIHLCAMSEDRQGDGFYQCPAVIQFAEY